MTDVNAPAALPEALPPDPSRPATVYVVEECACATTHGHQLATYLQRRLGPGVEVASIDRAHLSGISPLPPSASDHIQVMRDAKLPALVVDGRLCTEGVLPDFLDAVALIEGDPAVRAPVAATIQRSQCAPGTC